ncbi:MAG: hypothetical protein NXI00_16165, partial [Cytophagales bacterium]|nr:hypothetical protein [Cytophagales bacterium]
MTEAYNRKRNAAEGRIYTVIYRYLRDIYSKYYHIVLNGSPQVAIARLNEIDRQSMQAILEEVITHEAATFYLYEQDQLKKLISKKDFIRTDFETGFFSEVWRNRIRTVLRSGLLFERIVGITDTTKSDLTRILVGAINNRLTRRESAREISSQTGYLRKRALRIARTETTYAVSLGRDAAANDSGLKL